MMELEVRGMQPQAREREQPLEAGKAKEMDSPQSLQKEHICTNTLILAQGN